MSFELVFFSGEQHTIIFEKFYPTAPDARNAIKFLFFFIRFGGGATTDARHISSSIQLRKCNSESFYCIFTPAATASFGIAAVGAQITEKLKNNYPMAIPNVPNDPNVEITKIKHFYVRRDDEIERSKEKKEKMDSNV